MARRRLEGKRVVLTGATSGLGNSIAEELANHGVKLFLNGRREDLLRKISRSFQESGTQCGFVAGDITDSNVQRTLVDGCVDSFGGVDCLINNAGVGAMGMFGEANSSRLREIFELNFFAMAELSRLAIPHLTRGVDPIIVNIGSVLGHRAVPLKSEYCASKFAVHGFSDALRAELSAIPIEVLHVCPATIDTEFFDSALEDSTDRDWKSGAKMSPQFVATKTVSSIQRRKHELILPTKAHGLVWLDRLLPGLTDRLIAKFG